MQLPIEEVWINKRIVKVTLKGARDKPGTAADLFEYLASKGINIEMIAVGSSERGRANIGFVILESDYFKLKELEEELMELVNARDIKYDEKMAMIIFYGDKRMSRTPGVAATIFNILANAGVNIEMVSASLDSISIVIPQDRVDEARMVLQDSLGIDINEGYQYED